MTSENSVIVKASAKDTWKLIGEDFVAVDRWMAAIARSDAIPGPALPDAPARGRNSYLVKKFAPMYQEEILTAYDTTKMTLSVDVTLRDLPPFLRLNPIKGYLSTVIVEEIDDESCKVTWIGEAKPKWFAKPMKKTLTNGLDAGFIRSLEEIQHFMETGQPHPRKVEKMALETAIAA